MRNNISLLTILSVAMVFSSCGETPQTLEEKQQQLLQKKSELRMLTESISQLETEIRELDPTEAERSKIATVGAQEITPLPFQHYIDVQGQIEAKQNVGVSALTSGKLVSLSVREGQQVRKGQLLGQIDDAIIQASINEVANSLELSEELLSRQQRLWDQGIGTEVQLMEAKNRVEGLKKRLATQEEQKALTRIISPITGTVEQIMPKEGELVSPGFPAFQIVNNQDLSLIAKLSEAYIPHISKGDNVIVEFPTIDQSLTARVSVIGQTIHPNDRTFDVEVSLPSHPMLKPNMFGTLKINDNTIEEAVVLPLYMVQQSETGPFVYVAVQSGETWTAERRALTIGQSYKDQVTITDGLAIGDLFISSGYSDLSNGQEIEFDQAVAGK